MRRNSGKLVELELGELENLLIVGDIHGDYTSFRTILANSNLGYLIFLGDYADRGEMGYEVLEELMKLRSAENVVLLKGNHEDYSSSGIPNFSPCTLISEVYRKFGDWYSYFRSKLKTFLENLYLAAIVDGRILLLHGGISSKISGINDLRVPSREVEEDILWSDPDEEGEVPNWRGAGVKFGKDVTEKVLKKLGASLIIRSHQPNLARDGIYFSHGGKVVTISSTRVYGGIPHFLQIPKDRIDEICRTPTKLVKYVRFIK
ncbi:MAG: metallophosphoesterase family protein [Candidatus Nanoarchaeia archaeon]|nr:serine/threonine protein phosphatase [Candidatus Haiyanarchaeum thermophilum]MCW1303067.1 serine/threonine protein phosphatase [Candidatus Haiyanarchaeum thermophilum]MCW1303732.1 serine/threonine protein phosphatase [Candidatus Haiyanarchaeum thermophilum]MCW1306823.1 serine/threonine protein phosphatase [Candidatus Haiyanarchaeum thermophilum]MCW1307065.1 serine/threonine protein phosphatase [Candidatus Haiyanarchaeum thermophilum]